MTEATLVEVLADLDRDLDDLLASWTRLRRELAGTPPDTLAASLHRNLLLVGTRAVRRLDEQVTW